MISNYKQIISNIDKDIDNHVKRKDMYNLDDILDSHDIIGNNREIIGEYINCVVRNYEIEIDKFYSEYYKIKSYTDKLGIIFAGISSAFVGASLFYFFEPEILKSATAGLLSGFGGGYIESNMNIFGTAIMGRYQRRELAPCKVYQDKKREELLSNLDLLAKDDIESID